MTDNPNAALTRATAGKGGRRFWNVYLDTPEAALQAAKNGWWGGLWLAASGILSFVLGYGALSQDPTTLYVGMGIYGVLTVLGLGLAFLVRTFHPLWAIIVLLVLLSLWMVLAVLSLSIGLGLVINGFAIYAEVQAIRGCLRLARFRRGDLNPQQAGKVFE